MVLEADLTLSVGSAEIESNMSTVTLDLHSRIEQVFDDFHSQPKPQMAPDNLEVAELAESEEQTATDANVDLGSTEQADAIDDESQTAATDPDSNSDPEQEP